MSLLSNLHILKEIIINIYIFYSYEFNRNKKNIFNSFGLKLINETNEVIEVENIKTKDILKLGKINN